MPDLMAVHDFPFRLIPYPGNHHDTNPYIGTISSRALETPQPIPLLSS